MTATTEMAQLRVRGHVPPPAERPPRQTWLPRPEEPGLLLHVHADQRDQLTVATSRELIASGSGPVTIGERLFTTEALLDAVSALAAGLRADVPAGLDTRPLRTSRLEDLGKLLTRRSYRSRWPVVGWDLPWTLGRLAAHTGRAAGRGGGFSIAMPGTGIYLGDRWVPSWDHPRLLIIARPGGHGAFYSWSHPRTDRYTGDRPADFLDLQVLASALAGSDFDDPAVACAWFDIDWPTSDADPIQLLRAEAAALARLYAMLLARLADVAPGMAARDVWSFGSIATYTLNAANVTSPLRRAQS